MTESAGRGTIDDVIMPHATRPRIARAFGHAARQDGADAGAQARQFGGVTMG